MPLSYQWLIPPGVEKGNVGSVEVFVAFCKPLPTSICSENDQSTFYQKVTLNNGSVYEFDMGSFNKDNQFIPDAGEEDLIMLSKQFSCCFFLRVCEGRI